MHSCFETHLRGVEIKISWLKESQALISRIFWWARANEPGGSSFQNGRAHAAMYASWKSLWWYDRFQPPLSSASKAILHIAVWFSLGRRGEERGVPQNVLTPLHPLEPVPLDWPFGGATPFCLSQVGPELGRHGRLPGLADLDEAGQRRELAELVEAVVQLAARLLALDGVVLLPEPLVLDGVVGRVG